MLSVSEYGRIYLSDADETLDSGDLNLRKSHFRALMSLLENDEDDAADYQPIFTYLRPGGREQLRVQNYVGVIRLADGVQIEVLPKLSKRLESNRARAMLIRMLIELADSPFFEGTAADLDAHRMPLFELLLRCFLDQVVAIVRKGIARTYVATQGNLIFLRGKIQLAEQIRRNAHSSCRIHCEFDEFDVDRPINRLIKGALLIADQLVSTAENQQRCRELLFWFDRVPGTKDPVRDLQRVRRDRLMQHYEPAMPLCKLILNRLNPLTQQGENRVISMLFPMETVFESYVAAKLPSQLYGWFVESQVKGKALIDEHLARKMFHLIPDLMLKRADVEVIADTKWKLIDENDRSSRYGISQSDIYQLFGYSRNYLASQERREVILIYPASDTFTRPLEPFWYEKPNEVLHVVPYDIEMDRLHIPGNSVIRQEEDEVATG